MGLFDAERSDANLLAYLGFPVEGGRSQIDLVPADPAVLREAAERPGLTLSDTKPHSLFKETTASGQ